MKKILFSIICCCFISLFAPAQGVVFTPSQPQPNRQEVSKPDMMAAITIKAICTDPQYKYAGVDYMQGEKLYVIDKTEAAYATTDWFLKNFSMATVEGTSAQLVKKESQDGFMKLVYKFNFPDRPIYLVAIIGESRLYLMSMYE